MKHPKSQARAKLFLFGQLNSISGAIEKYPQEGALVFP